MCLNTNTRTKEHARRVHNTQRNAINITLRHSKHALRCLAATAAPEINAKPMCGCEARMLRYAGRTKCTDTHTHTRDLQMCKVTHFAVADGDSGRNFVSSFPRGDWERWFSIALSQSERWLAYIYISLGDAILCSRGVRCAFFWLAVIRVVLFCAGGWR